MDIPTSVPAKNPRVAIGEVFVKDVSFETVHSPMIFKKAREKWDPTVTPEYSAAINTIAKNWYEVILILTVKTVLDDEVAYVAEVHQAGLFGFLQYDADESQKLLRNYCLSFLFPFARETIFTLAQKGGFNQLTLPPIDFYDADVVRWEE